MQTHFKKEKKGFALLLALIVSSVVLAIGVSILDVSINQINLSATARESEFAFQAAHAGMDCMQFWRTERSSRYTGSLPNANIDCFGVNASPSTKGATQVVTGGIVDKYDYQFNWGSPARCTQVEMYVINAQTGNVTYTHPTNNAVGTNANGVITCRMGTSCTVVTSSGFNRSCSELASSIYSVERELTLEF